MFQTPTITLFACCQLSCRSACCHGGFFHGLYWRLPSRLSALFTPTTYSPTERNLMRFNRLTKWASEQSVSSNPSSFITFGQKLCSFCCNVEDLCHVVAKFVVLLQEVHPLRSVTVHKGLSKGAVCYLLWINVPNWVSVFVVLVASIRKILQLGLLCRPCDADTVALGEEFLRLLRLFPVSVIPSKLNIHIHVHGAPVRRTNDRSLRAFQKAAYFAKQGALDRKATLALH